MKTCAVIIPVLNGAKFIAETIDSVLQQTSLPDEIIVVDNGSTDNTIEVLEAYKKSIIVITELKKGVAAARNTGIKYAKSDLIAFMDADDICKPTRIERQIDLFGQDSSVVMVFGAYQFMDIGGTLFEGEVRCSKFIKKSFFGELLERNQIATPTVMLKKSVIEKVGFFDEYLLSNAEDYDLWLRIASQYTIHYQDDVCVYVRIHGKSSSTNREAQINNSIKAIKKYSLEHIWNALDGTYKNKNNARLSYIKILFFIGMYDEAKKYLLELLEQKVLVVDSYFMLANVWVKKQHLDKAKECYEQCIQINKQFAEAYNNLGIIHAIDKSSVHARKLFNKARDLKLYYSDPINNINNLENSGSKWCYTFFPLRDVLKPSE